MPRPAASFCYSRCTVDRRGQKLRDNRSTCPLFDTGRFRRQLETAYATMWDIARRGETLRSFAVTAVE
jgi:predicted O-linked N-acetylglucosamine transferase (SPINDLY family)